MAPGSQPNAGAGKTVVLLSGPKLATVAWLFLSFLRHFARLFLNHTYIEERKLIQINGAIRTSPFAWYAWL